MLETKGNFADEYFLSTFFYDASMVNCILAVIIKYICIAKKPGCCSFKSVSEYLTIEITATQLIKTLVKIFGEAGKVPTGCCSGNDLTKIYDCKNLDLNYILSFLVDVRVLGSLRDENGN